MALWQYSKHGGGRKEDLRDVRIVNIEESASDLFLPS
jgi:hypothetical protein